MWQRRIGLHACLAAIALAMPAGASECKNPTHPERFLPPPEYRQEPTLPYERWDAETLNVAIGVFPGEDAGGKQMLGLYVLDQDAVIICKGISGRSLRIIRMHEEAHRRGWRHPA